MPKILFFHDLRRGAEIDYAFRILASSIDCDLITERNGELHDDKDAIVVSYGYNIPLKTYPNHLHICADPSFWENFGHAESLPDKPLKRISLRDLNLRSNERLEDPLICPYVHEGNKPEPVYWKQGRPEGRPIRVCKLDLVASAFLWITRYEETLAPERDEYTRVLEDRLLCVRENCFSRPLVDEYAEALFQLLSQFEVPFQASRGSLRVLVTHDVDSGIPVKGGLEYFEYGLRSLYRETFREHRFGAGLSDCCQWFAVGLGLRSYAQVFHQIVSEDRKYGFTSHFFIMANGTHPQDSRSDIFSEYSRRVIHEIKSSGGQIGLHLGINAHKSSAQFKKEWNNIREVVAGALPAARAHYLIFHVPDTWKTLSDVGCRVDSSLGFSERMGFRAGTSRPFQPFDVVNRCVVRLWEYPMIIMDKNLFVMQARSDQDRVEKALQIIDKVIAHGGCLVINWHNMYFFSDYLRMYTEILAYLTKRGNDACLESGPEPDQKVIW